jgi:hypothetical protein
MECIQPNWYSFCVKCGDDGEKIMVGNIGKYRGFRGGGSISLIEKETVAEGMSAGTKSPVDLTLDDQGMRVMWTTVFIWSFGRYMV